VDGPEAEPLDEAVKDRQGADGVGVEGTAGGAGGTAGPERWRGRLVGACGFVVHGSSPDADQPRWRVRASGPLAPPP
jgi:hypothetical protein